MISSEVFTPQDLDTRLTAWLFLFQAAIIRDLALLARSCMMCFMPLPYCFTDGRPHQPRVVLREALIENFSNGPPF